MQKQFKNILLFSLLLIAENNFSQVVGGRGNSQSSPKEVKASELSKGAYTADVNLFTGGLSTSYALGTVSTPSGLSYTLSMGYSSTFTGGDNVPTSKGIPYGEGWSLSLPGISVSTEEFNKYKMSEIETNSRFFNDANFSKFEGADAVVEGKTFWFAPEISIPGVISERFVYKYTEREGGQKGDMVFVPARFDSYAEARLRNGVWRVITEDGTVYEFGVSVINIRNSSNQRYIVDNTLNTSTGFYEPDKPYQDVFTPQYEYLTWTISKIYHPNYPNGQQIQFIYENFGAFNYYQELLQPKLVDALAFNGYTAAHNFNVYKDVLLKTVRSVENFGTDYIEKIELNYKTIFPTNGANLLLPQQTNVYRRDSLYNYTTVYSTGMHNTAEQTALGSNAPLTTTGNFNNWLRYHHLRSTTAQGTPSFSSNMHMDASNPYVSDGNTGALDGGSDPDPLNLNSFLLRNSTAGNDLAFDDCFLESPKIGYSGQYFPSGDIYEVRTLINNSAAEKFCNFDINIVAGQIDPTGAYSEPSSVSSTITQLSQHVFARNRKTVLFSTFNQPIKWNTAAASSTGNILVTSNYFTMPNLPIEFQGFRIQVGPGNSDHNFALYGNLGLDIADLTLPSTPNAYRAYYNQIYSGLTVPDLQKYGYGCSPASNNFGIGLEWHMMRRIYSDIVNDGNYNERSNRYKRWWNLVPTTSMTNVWANKPTLADANVQLMAIELIRYSKNPYMLSSVETYRINGADNTTGMDKEILLSKVALEYELEVNTVANNYEPSPYYGATPSSTNNYQKQNVFLLKRIKEVPVNSANDNAVVPGFDLELVPTTHYGYTKITTTQIGTTEGQRVNTDVFAITSITDRLGGTTTYEYNPFDFLTSLISNNEKWHPATSLELNTLYQNDIQMGKPYAISFILSVKKKIVEDHTGAGTLIKDWEYTYQTPRIRHVRPDNLGPRFYISSTKKENGYEKTIVKEPLLSAGANRAKTEYTHYANEESGLLFGKLKQAFSYNVAGQQVEKKDYEYVVKSAYENGAYRTQSDAIVPGTNIDNYYDNPTRRHYSGKWGDYAYLNANITIGTPPVNANLTATVLFTGTLISSMPFMEEGNKLLFSGQYLTSYFTALKKETTTSYDIQPSTTTSITIGLTSSLVSPAIIGSTRSMLDIASPVGTPLFKYNSRSYSNITEYEYWDADPLGNTSCEGNKLLVNSTAVPFSYPLVYEPSWQLYRKKTHSPELPDAYNTEENFYFHDIREIAYNSSSPGDIDTVTNFFALNYTSGYKLRNLPYETRITTKSQGYSPITKSSYFWYDSRFVTETDFEVDDEIEFTSEYECLTFPTPPTPPATDCVAELPGHPVPPGYELVIDAATLRWWCPTGMLVEKTAEPHLPYQQPGASRTEIHFRNLKNRLFLRYTAQQIDTVRNVTADYLDLDVIPRLTRFKYNSAAQYYKPLYPYVNLTDKYIEERNIYGQVALEHDAKGLKTLYEYDPEQTILFTDPVETCNSHYLQVFTNMGLPKSVIVGHTLPEALTTNYTYYKDHSIETVTDPNAMEMKYVYDEYTRLNKTFRNSILLSLNNYHYWQNNFAQSFDDRAKENYVESYTVNESGSTVAERSRAYMDPQGRKYDVLTQISPDYSTPTAFDTKMIHTGLTNYDNWNRSIKQYKPFKVTNAAGVNFDPDITAGTLFTESQHESSQRNHTIRGSKYGQDIVTGYTVNSSYMLIKGDVLAAELSLSVAEKALIVPGISANYIFLKTAAIDEDGKKVVTYSDALGRQVATKTYITMSNAPVTLFIYNSQGQQAIVINPLKQQSTYEYNLLGQLYKKNTVDAGEVRYIYNSDGQVVLEEDANARAGTDNSNNPYMRRFSFDAFGRFVKQERVTAPADHSHPFFWQNLNDDDNPNDAADAGWSTPDFQLYYGYAASTDYAFSLQKYNYLWLRWDNTTPYDYLTSIGVEKDFFYHNALSASTGYLHSQLSAYLGSSPQTNLKGRLSHALAYNSTNAKIKLTAYSYNSDGTAKYELHQFEPSALASSSVSAFAQVIEYKNYNLRGSPKQILVNSGADGSVEMTLDYAYDGWNRLSNVAANTFKLAEYQYIDELGLLDHVKYLAQGGGCNMEVDDINYTYDDRDRLTNLSSTLFGQELYYDGNLPSTGTSVYNVTGSLNRNGNINASKATYNANLASNYAIIGNSMDGATHYGYIYDGMNRLTRADASVMNVLTSSTPSSSDPQLKYGDETMSYDRAGNIFVMVRGAYYLPGFPAPNVVTSWRYKYTTGTNKLYKIVENITPFTTDVANYTYDVNGNLRSDDKKLLSPIAYGRANLPVSLTANSKNLAYLYNEKDSRIYKANTTDNTKEYYLQDASGRTLGIFDINSNQWTWYAYGKDRIAKLGQSGNEYYVTDHLGNTRVTYTPTVNCEPQSVTYTILNANDYFSTGKLLRSFAGTGLDKYGYQGSEREKEISDNDYYTLFRGLDVDIFRWKQFDPKWSQSWSPYAAMNCNPVMFNDPLGDVVDYGKLGEGGLRNRINSGLSRLFSNNYRQQFNTWQNQAQIFSLNQVAGMPSLKSGGQLSTGANANQTMVNYSPFEGKPIKAFGTHDVHLQDNSPGTNNPGAPQTVNNVVPGSNVIIKPLPHPDEITFTNQNGGLVTPQASYVSAGNGVSFNNIAGFAPVTNLTPATGGGTTSFPVPAGTTNITVGQRSSTNWSYTDPNGLQQNHTDPNSQWNVTITKYNVTIPWFH